MKYSSIERERSREGMKYSSIEREQEYGRSIVV